MNKIAIVMSEFNSDVTHELLKGCMSRLVELGMIEENICIFKVPGAVEIPLTAKLLAKSKKYQTIICLGAIIRGDTDHYDYVCQQVSYGSQQVMLEYEIPVIFGILTTHNMEQAQDRIGGKEGHKGKDAADAALAMLALMDQIK